VAHGGSLQAENLVDPQTETLKGARFTLSLPSGEEP